ncbi:MAG: ABC transporter ATP-binding protein [Burkholderiaceae bacterium]
MSLLQLKDISQEFSGVRALDNVSLDVSQGSVTSLIGPNGAGKTTLVNIITGVLSPTRGSLFFEGDQLDEIKPNRIAKLGIRRTFQTVRLFPGLTVLENIIIGQYAETARRSALSTLFSFGSEERERRSKASELMQRFGLEKDAHTIASELSYGTQRRVEIARALAGEPKLLILDEPAAGMNDVETTQLRSDIHAVRQAGITVFLIEHDMSLVMSVSDQVIVLNFGKKIAQGSPAEVSQDPEVIRSYLGASRASK